MDNMKTKIVVLGTGHSNQLVSRECQPAAYRAFFDRVKPDVIGIERSPLEYLRSDFYEFTYEQQNIIVPYAREKKIKVCPFDWLPSQDDSQLAWGMGDIEQPPPIRAEGSYKDFLHFDKSVVFEEGFFYAESPELQAKMDDWITTKRDGEKDFPRRFFLYRTYMQAMRIKHIAKEYKGGTFLVVVGYMHKQDIEKILSNVPFIEIIPASAFGYPTKEEIENNILEEDLLAIATFNLMGVQSKNAVNWEWLKVILQTLDQRRQDTEVEFLKIKLEALTNIKSSSEIIEKYEHLLRKVDSKATFTYDGVKDRKRIDSFFDPFGNLSILNRVQIELAREYARVKNMEKVGEIKELLLEQHRHSALQKLQLSAYWDKYVLEMP